MGVSLLRDRLSKSLGAEGVAWRAVTGGDVCKAWRVELSDGASLFVKSPRTPVPGMMSAEARGLAWLTETGTLRVPRVHSWREAEGDAPAYLALEWIESAGAGPDFDEVLGRGLAALHRAPCPQFGLEGDNFIGPLGQSNTAHGSWGHFYLHERLEPLLGRAVDAGVLSFQVARRVHLEAIEGRLAGEEPPSRLHGDLWSGNCLVDASGRPCLVDPAVYGGHREMDLGMMRLFGGFSERVFAAYDEAYPLAPGYAERLALHQLYPLLVHLNLFGDGYRSGVERAIEALA